MLKFNFKAVAGALIAAGLVSATGVAVAGSTSANLVVNATLTSGCDVQAGTISFGSITALLSSGDKTADSDTSFAVACSSGVTPTIASLTPRSMTDGAAHSLPFNLSLTSGASANDLGSTTPSALTITQDGTLQTVTIFAKVLASNFAALPAGIYANTMVVNVAY